MSLAPDPGEAAVAAARAAPVRPLPPGTRLRDYEIQAAVAEGDIAIVYAAWDHSLQRKVAVKEFMPPSMAARVDGSTLVAVTSHDHVEAFRAGLKSFVAEARQLARFDHPSLIKVYRFWEENGTAVMVMPFHEGPTLTAALATLGHVPGEAELRAWLRPVLNAVTVLHAGRTWHQNIGPDEILLTPVGPVLLGFGAAARAIAARRQAPAQALAAGFAAPEQYGADAGTAVGPWTDLYALAAVLYGAIAGAPPDVATDRLTGDALQPLSQVAAGLYGAGFLAAIDAALALRVEDRPQDHEAFRARMGDIDAPEAMSLAPPRDLMQEPFLGDVASQREVTVPDRPLTAAAASLSAAVLAADTRRGASPSLPLRATGGNAAFDSMRDQPAWAEADAARGRGSRRSLYGVIAATCAGIGIAAVALQFYLRPPARAPLAAAGATSAAAASLAPSSSVTAGPGGSTSPSAVVRADNPSLPTTAATPATTSSLGSIATMTPESASAVASSAATGAPERQARCIDILQKASLERISAADTEFFKKECK